jgi:hypothetical protein
MGLSGEEHLSRLHSRGYARHDAYPGNVVTLGVMVSAYAAAFERYKHATGELQSATLAYAPLAEALGRAVSIDDRIRKHWAPEGTPLGWDWRARVPEADIWKDGGVSSVHRRSLAGTKCLQTAGSWSERPRRPESGRGETGGRNVDGKPVTLHRRLSRADLGLIRLIAGGPLGPPRAG